MKWKGRRQSKNVIELKGDQSVAPTIYGKSTTGEIGNTPNEKKIDQAWKGRTNQSLREKASIKEMKPRQEDKMGELIKNASKPAYEVDTRLNRRKNLKESAAPGKFSKKNKPIDSDVFHKDAKFLNPKKY